ncbi:hypothetical protein M378DRAFT_20616 [Amanita muscaria Koide BX008]|uniref:Uncharacterized protein n=1 Tax=Amanita muscaria (strain Koide BX008) TaxID=946122 RepID=A0A0C2XKU1_AMAMK|nr:hypothetical protein M378DRAFT_20616 [Amanita muscaria Koide BX008]
MDESTSLRKLALLPKLDPVERTSSHVRAQSAYLTFYASEGRAYMTSWKDDSESNIAKNTVEKETAIINLGTPVLKPRVKPVSKSVISVCSTKSGEKSRAKATTKTSKKRNDEQGADNGEKRKVKADRSKRTGKKTQPKKKRNQSLSDSSSAAERLKERREKKRAKRAIVSPPSSSDKENVEEKRATRKKMPVGFALMHGFTATNVGKNRLTVKPSVSIGVFNKGKASVKTKGTKTKASGTKGHAAAYFSESMFLNKTKAVLEEEDESSCVTPSSGAAVKKSSKKKSKKKVDDASSKVSDIKSAPTPSSSPKKPSAASIVWDIELGKSLCSIDPPIFTAPAEKLGSVVLDVTRHSWAKLLDRRDTNQNKTPIVAMSRPGTGSKGESEALASIGPSQSASQIITKITSPAKRGLQEAHRSKYFQAEPTKPQYEIRAESTSPPSVPDDVKHLPALEEYDQPAQETNAAADLQFPTEIPEVAPGLQQEPRCNCQVATEVTVSPFDILDQEQDCTLGAEDVDDPIWTGHEEINYFDDPFGEHVNLEDGEIPVLEQDYFMNDATGWELELESGYNFFQDCDFADDLTQDHDCLVSNAIHEDMEMDDCYDYVSIEGYEDPGCSEAEEAIGFDQNEDCETTGSGQCLSESSEREDTEQVHRFSQGRALLSGCSVQEIRHSSKTPAQYPRLFLLEADVAKSLRDHWHPQRL